MIDIFWAITALVIALAFGVAVFIAAEECSSLGGRLVNGPLGFICAEEKK